MKRKKHNRKLLNKLKVLNNHNYLLKIRLRDHNKLQLLNKMSRCNSLGQDPLGQAVFDHQWTQDSKIRWTELSHNLQSKV